MARWPSPQLVTVIALWVVPGAVMFSPTPFGEWLALFTSFTLAIVVWLALPIPVLIGGLIWIARIRPAARIRWLWIMAWIAVVTIGAPAVFFVPRIIGPIGHGMTSVGIMGSDTANTGDMIAQSVAFVIFGAAAMTLLTCAARSARRQRGDLG
jgi:hypothetical protein